MNFVLGLSRNLVVAVLLLGLMIFDSGPVVGQDKSQQLVPAKVNFQKETLKRIGRAGDNWCTTWAKDGSQITNMCDGNWTGVQEPSFIHTNVYRITGDAASFEKSDIFAYPDFSGEEGSWFGYGIVAVDDNVYSVISKTPGTSWSGPFTGIKILKSADNGQTWRRINRKGQEQLLEDKSPLRNVVNEEEMFFLKEYGMRHKEQKAYPFSFVSFVQNGKNGSASKDEFVYVYAPEGAHAHKLTLARVPKDSFGVRDKWEYFTRFDENQISNWSSEIEKRGYVHEFPDRNKDGQVFGWYSWLPSVVWNEGLGLYIMVNGGTYGGHGMTDSDKDYYHPWMHTETGSLGFWYSENPYGPWTQFFYTEKWTVDDPANRTYQPKLSPKWISADGKQMTLIWSDAMKNDKGKSHTVNYLWNQMQITIDLK